MANAQTVPQQITAFLMANKNIWFCNSCIQTKLGLKRPQQAQQSTAPLGAGAAFTRTDGICSVCGKNVKVIKAN